MCTWQESNLQSLGPQPNVLSIELQALYFQFTIKILKNQFDLINIYD